MKKPIVYLQRKEALFEIGFYDRELCFWLGARLGNKELNIC
jgi:hypothetical protein